MIKMKKYIECYKCKKTFEDNREIIKHYIKQEWRKVCTPCKKQLLNKMYKDIIEI